ncbi:FecCD family ABC transporter permease [Mycetocola spongiae]|uniref:FecCD family ABC transporter permease n=1 Tax=Mycetocola spongiae TaxID=2859226 RepID=UPI001CF25BF0|nr:iron chelate uptake ABC transporter family permease subunit [Mycetocola spongiae]UCR88899.1 iron chelate uptake ABC transporter family permease subunit [Mycetocola spongiae]
MTRPGPTQTTNAGESLSGPGRTPPATGLGATPEDGPRGLVRSTGGRLLGLLIVAIILVLVAIASLAFGSKTIDPAVVWSVLLRGDGSEDAYIVRDMRVPRAALGLLVGAALGVSGALIQALTRNPLADPGILGVGAGASFAVTIGAGYFGITAVSGYIWFAFIGAMAVTVLVYALGSVGRAGATPIRLTLVGVALGALLSGISMGITLLNPQTLDKMRMWGAGSLSGRGWDVILTVAPFIALGLLLALMSARPLNAVALGDDLARSLGANIIRTRILVIIAVTLLAGAATAAAGPIGFVGLMVPHAVRWLVGPDQRWIMPYTLLCAPILLLFSDVLGRVVLAPMELQVGIVTAFVGAPVLIGLVRRAKISGL